MTRRELPRQTAGRRTKLKSIKKKRSFKKSNRRANRKQNKSKSFLGQIGGFVRDASVQFFKIGNGK